MYVDSLACVRVKLGENEQFRIDSGVRKRCIMSSWFFNVYMDTVLREVKKGSEFPGGRERVQITWPLLCS